MKHLVKSILISTLLVAVLIPAGYALADTGPKPTLDFQFSFEAGVNESSIVSGVLFECSEADCSDAAPLAELGPQGLYCEAQSCHAIGYGFAQYHMLDIDFSDGVSRRSNVFETEDFDSFYTVYVRPDDLYIEPRFNPLAVPAWIGISVMCAAVLLLVGLAVWLVKFLRRRARQ